MAGGRWLKEQLAYWCNIAALDDMTDDRDALAADVALYMTEREMVP